MIVFKLLTTGYSIELNLKWGHLSDHQSCDIWNAVSFSLLVEGVKIARSIEAELEEKLQFQVRLILEDFEDRVLKISKKFHI